MVALPFVRRHIKLLLTVLAALALGVLGLWVWPIPRGMERCATHLVQRLPGPGVYDAEVTETGCWGVSGSDTMSVELVSRVDEKEATIFQYGRKAADPNLPREDVPPTVTWLGENRLAISIDMVSYVEKRIDERDGVKIEYHIGVVEGR